MRKNFFKTKVLLSLCMCIVGMLLHFNADMKVIAGSNGLSVNIRMKDRKDVDGGTVVTFYQDSEKESGIVVHNPYLKNQNDNYVLGQQLEQENQNPESIVHTEPIIEGYKVIKPQTQQTIIDTSKYYLIVTVGADNTVYALYGNPNGMGYSPGNLVSETVQGSEGRVVAVIKNGEANPTATYKNDGSNLDLNNLEFRIIPTVDGKYSFRSAEGYYLDLNSGMFSKTQTSISLTIKTDGDIIAKNDSAGRYLHFNAQGEISVNGVANGQSAFKTDFWGCIADPATYKIYLYEKEGSTINSADLRELQMEVDKVNEANYQEEDYTLNTWDIFKKALTAAQDILKSQETIAVERQSDVDALRDTLANAVLGLGRKPQYESPSIFEYHLFTGEVSELKTGDIFSIYSKSGNDRVLYVSEGDMTGKLQATLNSDGSKLTLGTGSIFSVEQQLFEVESIDGDNIIIRNVDANGKRYLDLTRKSENNIYLTNEKKPLNITKSEEEGTYCIKSADQGGYALKYQGTSFSTSEEATPVRLYVKTQIVPEIADSNPPKGFTQGQPLIPGTAGSENFRIPSLITLSDGTILAAADARWNHAMDFSAIDIILSKSTDYGQTWECDFPIYCNDSTNARNNWATTFMYPVMVRDKNDKIYLMADVYPGSVATAYAPYQPEKASGYVEINGKKRLVLYTSPYPDNQDGNNYSYYVGDHEEGGQGLAPIYEVISNGNYSDKPSYYMDKKFNLYDVNKEPMYCQQLNSSNIVQQNVFFWNSILHVRVAMYIYLITSEDGGETWSEPMIINPQVRLEDGNDSFFGTGSGAGLWIDDNSEHGIVIMPTYSATTAGSQRAQFIYSKDGGKTWDRADNATKDFWSGENCLVQIDGTTVRHFYRSDNAAVLQYTDHTYDGDKWVVGTPVRMDDIARTSNNQISALRYSRTIGGEPVIIYSTAAKNSSERKNGTLYIFTVDMDGTNKPMNLVKTYDLVPDTEDDYFAYSSIAELNDGSIGLLYESAGSQITYKEISKKEIFEGLTFDQQAYDGIKISGDLSKVYDGKPADVSLLSLDKGDIDGETEYTFYQDEDKETVLEEVPVNVGDYWVEVSVQPRGETFSVVSNLLSFSIRKENLTIEDAVLEWSVVDETSVPVLGVNSIAFGGLVEGESLVKDTDYTAEVVLISENDYRTSQNKATVMQETAHETTVTKTAVITVDLIETANALNYELKDNIFEKSVEVPNAIGEQSGQCGDNITWKILNGELMIQGTGRMWDFSMGESPWHAYKEYFTQLTIGENITYIGNYAFYGCDNLEGELVLPEGLNTIGDKAFSGCSNLQGTLDLPDSLTSIGGYAFEQCSGLSGDLNLPDGITGLGEGAFSGCSGFDGELTIPSGIKAIEDKVFDGCSGLTGELVIPENITDIGESSFQGCDGLSGELRIPDTVTNIEDSAFNDCGGIDSVVFEGDKPALGTDSFGGMTADIYYPTNNDTWDDMSGTENMGDNLNWIIHHGGKCGDNLTYKLAEGTLSITGKGDMWDFTSDSSPWYTHRDEISTLVIGAGVTSIGNYAFYECSSLEGDFILPETIKKVGGYAFYGCTNLQGTLILPKGITQIGSHAFYGCGSLTGDLNLHDGITSLGEGAFAGCSGLDGQLTLPSGITRIEKSVFEGCTGLTGELVLPKGVSEIGEKVFAGYSGFMEEVKMPDSVVSIGGSAFYDCSGITTITFYGNQPVFGTDCFGEMTADVYYPFSNATWDNPSERDNTGGNLTWIGYQNGQCGDNLTYDLVDGILTITGTGDMWDFTSDSSPWYKHRNAITTLVLGEGVTGIGNYAFYDCGNLTGQLNLPKGVTRIGEAAFGGCQGLEGNLMLPGKLAVLGNSAFKNCSGFTGDIVIPAGITVIEVSVFENCSGFDGSIILPETVGKICDNALSGCTGIQEIMFEGKQPEFAAQIFVGVTADAYYPENDPTWSNVLATGGFGGNLTWIGYEKPVEREGKCGNNLTWKLEDGILTISGSGDMWNYGNGSRYGLESPWYYYREEITELRLSENITSIGNRAFYRNASLSGALMLPRNLTRIGSFAFAYCESLEDSLRLPESITMIGRRAFDSCSGFTGDLVIPSGVTSLGEGAFYGCNGFDGQLVISEAIRVLEDNVFYECSGFTGELQLPKGLDRIGNGAFYGCGGFVGNLVIPQDVTEIGEFAFSECGSLEGKLDFPEKLDIVGSEAFSGCIGFTTVIFRGNCPVFGESPFTDIEADAYCPAYDSSWKGIEKREDLGGIFNWIFDVELAAGVKVMGVRDKTYTGKKQTHNIRVSYEGLTLVEGKDYTVVHKNNKNIYTIKEGEKGFNGNSAPYVEIKLKGNNTGSRRIYYRILPVDLLETKLHTDKLTAMVKSEALYQYVPAISWKGKKLKLNKDFVLEENNGFEVGSHTVTLRGINGFTGFIEAELNVLDEAESREMGEVLMNKVVVKKAEKSMPWKDEGVELAGFTVEYKKKLLTEEEYEVSYEFNKAVGTGYMILTGTGDDANDDGYYFTGTKTVPFKIVGTSMNKKNIQVRGLVDRTYTGEYICPTEEKGEDAVTLSSSQGKLEEGIHYTVSYTKNLEKGKANVFFTGIESAGYSGTLKASFSILPSHIDQVSVNMMEADFTDNRWKVLYTKGATTPEISLATAEGILLEEGKDYSVKYSNHKKAGTGNILIKGKGNYNGTREVAFEILPKALSNENGIQVVVKDKIVNSKPGAWKQKVKVLDSNGKILGAKDYDKNNIVFTLIERGGIPVEETVLSPSDICRAGDVIQVTVTGRGDYAGDNGSIATATGTYRLINKGYDIGNATIIISPQEYTGREIEIINNDQFEEGKVYLTLPDGRREVLELGKNIEVVQGSYKKNINTGKAKVTFRGMGEGGLGGTRTVTFMIKPRNLFPAG